MKKIRLSLNRKGCTGCSFCVEHAPDRWEMAEDGRSNLIGGKEHHGTFSITLDGFEYEENHIAQMGCEGRVIKIEELK